MKQTNAEIFTGRDGRSVAADIPGITQDGSDIYGGVKSDTFYS